jgi:hypothetical protein
MLNFNTLNENQQTLLMIFIIKDLFLKLASGLFTLLFVYLFIIFGTSDYIMNPSFKLERVIVALFLIITMLALTSCYRNSELWIIDKILFAGFLLSFCGQELLWPFLGWRAEFEIYQLVYSIALIIFVYLIFKSLYTRYLTILKFLALYLLYECYYLFTHVLYAIE